MGDLADTRFWARVRRSEGCWEWTGYIDEDGYGRFITPRSEGRECLGAHQYAYRSQIGPVAVGLELDHLCRNRRCVNPSHLEPVTKRENWLRGESLSRKNAEKDICKNGHDLRHPRNTYNRPGGRGRTCRICNAASVRSYKARNRMVRA